MTVDLLLDTHILLWLRVRPEKLIRAELDTARSARKLYASVVSLWEFAILMGLGRIERNLRLLELSGGYELLTISPVHCQAVAKLPQHHRDPFDRMLIAQAQAESLSLLTRDRAIAAYSSEATIIRFPGA